jgi:RimJ/RimL family protein N-acetyltransferase
MENNTIAINLYTKMGFCLEGTQRQAIFRDGKYVNYLMMSILKEEYNSENDS